MGNDERFRDLVQRGTSLDYATRCRRVAEEVRRQYAAPNGPAVRTWLDGELAAASSVPGTVVELLQRLAAAEQGVGRRPADLRAWTWRHLQPADEQSWQGGAESREMWSLLMSPAPADDDELGCLAASSQLAIDELSALTERARELLPTAAPSPGGARE